MLMIPITYLPATGLVLVAMWVGTRMYGQHAIHWMLAFLSCLALQLFLLGTRYGYQVDAVLNVQHLTGVLIPPLAYLAFANPPFSARVLVHGLPLVGIGLALFFFISLVDTVLAVITLGYAIGLVVIYRRNGDDLFSWAPLRHASTLRFGLFTSVAVLVLSGSTDAVVAVDFWATGGIQTEAIVAVASIGGIALLVVGLVVVLWPRKTPQTMQTADTDAALVEKLTRDLVRKQLFRDPDLTLSRLAKRLALPAREISQAVNRNTGLNMSQFINNMRIAATCEVLEETDVPITTAMLEAGFYTKSNFNREFRRVMGQTPTDWRRRAKSVVAAGSRK